MMKKDSGKNTNFSQEQIRQVLGSAEGRQLLALLSRGGGKELRMAAEEFKKGNVDGAKDLLAPLVQTPEASALLNKINEK